MFNLTPVGEMNALQKFGLLLRGASDPGAIMNYVKATDEQAEKNKKLEREKALADFAASANVPANLRPLFQASPELLPQYMLDQADPLKRAQLANAQASMASAQAERERAQNDANIFGRLGQGAVGDTGPQIPMDRETALMSLARNNPDKWGGEYFKATATADDPAELTAAMKMRKIKIQDAMRLSGTDEDTATAIVDGRLEITSDPTTNQPFLVDKARGTSRPLNIPQQPLPDDVAAQGAPERSLYSMTENTAGVVPGALSAYSALAGQVGLPIARQTVEDRQSMETAQNGLIRAMSINDKFPVGEIKRIQEEINIAPDILDSPPAAQARMRSIDKSLRKTMAQQEVTARDVSLPKETRQSAASNANAIRNFLGTLGVPNSNKTTVSYDDPEKEKRYQEWKKSQEKP